MVSLRKYYSFAASSILESVIALCIISICLYIAILVFAAVFTANTTVRYYSSGNQLNEQFYLYQIKSDSLSDAENDTIIREQEAIGEGILKVTVSYKDSTKYNLKKTFYIQNDKE